MRARFWPLLALVFAVALVSSCATLVFSAAASTASHRDDHGARFDTAAVRANASSPELVRGPLTEEARGGSREDPSPASEVRAAAPTAPAIFPPVGTPSGRDDPAAMSSRIGSDSSTSIEVAKPEPAILAIIRTAALRHGLDPDRMVAVARCESTLDLYAVGNAQELGLFQWKPTSWKFIARVSGLGYRIDRIFDAEAQSEMAAWAFANGYASWWTCR